MYYIYLLRSKNNPGKTYIGYTTNLNRRFKKHNEGGSFHTKENRPWVLVAYICLDSKSKALSFEKYLKVGSGYAFAKKRFW
ncbi:GIY-YIG nuclease family protein [bacterium]|nr:GIY-YIG nuclease family protein [bacterium]